MKKYTKDSYVFVLKGNKTAPRSFSIPLTAQIYEDGDVKEIRYVEGQRSIYVEEQKNIPKRLKKIVFYNGVLRVSRKEVVKLDFLFKCPWLSGNEEYKVTSKVKTLFEELDPVKNAKKELTQMKSYASSMALASQLENSFETKAKPLAYFLGYDINRESDLILHDLFVYATEDPEGFVDLFDDVVIERVYEIKQAVDKGVIKFSDNNVRWARTNKPIIQVPMSEDDWMSYFADTTYKQAADSWRAIVKEMNPKSKEEAEKATSPEVSEEMKPEALLELCLAKGVVKKSGSFYKLGDEKLSGESGTERGKAGAMYYFNKPAFREEVIKKLKEMV